VLNKKQKRSVRKVGFKHSNGKTLYILWAGLAACWLDDYHDSFRVIAATMAMLIVTPVCFRNWEAGVKALHWITLAGVFSIFRFFPFDLFFGVPFGAISIGIDLSMTIVAYLLFYDNEKILRPYIKNYILLFLTPSERSKRKWKMIWEFFEPDSTASSEERKNTFKQKYASKSKAELKKIAEDNRYRHEAILAAKELLEERENSPEGAKRP